MNKDIERAARILRSGGLVAFPTETVYGLGADASSAPAVAKLYAVKRRPADHPVIVHFASADAAFGWAHEVPQSARQLANAFWPGPLTLVLKRSQKAQDFVTGGQDTVGLRLPSHPVAKRNGDRSLRGALPDDVLVEFGDDLFRRQRLGRRLRGFRKKDGH